MSRQNDPSGKLELPRQLIVPEVARRASLVGNLPTQMVRLRVFSSKEEISQSAKTDPTVVRDKRKKLATPKKRRYFIALG